MPTQRWIPKLKKGALSRQLHIPESENIPLSVLSLIKRSQIGTKIHFRNHTIPVTRLLKKRATLAYTLKTFK